MIMFKISHDSKLLDENSINTDIHQQIQKSIQKSITVGNYKYDYYCVYKHPRFIASPILNTNFHWEVDSAPKQSNSSSTLVLSFEQRNIISKIKKSLAQLKVAPYTPPQLAYLPEDIDLQMEDLPSPITTDEIHAAQESQSPEPNIDNDSATLTLDSSEKIIDRISSIPHAEGVSRPYYATCPIFKIPMSKRDMVKLTLRAKNASGELISQTIICSREAAYHCAIKSSKYTKKSVTENRKQNKLTGKFTFQPLKISDIQQVKLDGEIFFPFAENDVFAKFAANEEFNMPIPIKHL